MTVDEFVHASVGASVAAAGNTASTIENVLNGEIDLVLAGVRDFDAIYWYIEAVMMVMILRVESTCGRARTHTLVAASSFVESKTNDITTLRKYTFM